MIRPRFNLFQDEKTVSIVIRAPYCSLKELDISVEENIFIFSCQPYYLRLHLPGQIEDNDHTKSSFDSDTGEFTFHYQKLQVGEHFPNLEFVTTLLCTNINIGQGSRKIEILEPESEVVNAPAENGDGGEVQYGFAMRGGYNFKVLSTEFSDVFDVDPLEVKLGDRQRQRLQSEQSQFNPDHYLADMLDNDEINEIVRLELPWKNLTEMDLQFTPDELDFLKDLSNINYNLSQQQIKYCHNSLFEILFAYCYDYRTTCFERTCESSWTITKLSASLCWFDSFLNAKEAIICGFRRSLIYPLYREFDLCQRVLNDLKVLLRLGERFIIKCLINIHNIFLTGDSGRYIFNNLFIKDYIVYVMKWDKELWASRVEELRNVVIEKKDLGLNLLEIEARDSENVLTETMASLSINNQSDSDDLTISSCDSEEDSTETD